MPRTPLPITGSSLTHAHVAAVVADPQLRVALAPQVRTRTRRAREALERTLTSHITYGVNTGFGPMASHVIGKDELVQLQYNLVRSHATGMGSALPPEASLAAMLVRLNTLAQGWSGTSETVLDQLAAFINHRILPVVPEHGGVGASGDLVQLAHIALALIGEGDVVHGDQRMPAARALRRCGLKPLVLAPKDGLSLINGTSFMTGVGSLVCTDAERLLSLAVRNGAWALELVGSFEDGFSERLSVLRPHPGQQAVAAALRSLVRGSRLLRRRAQFQRKFPVNDHVHEIPEDVQEYYSLRCIPQIVGPVREATWTALRTVSVEMNSATDNPLVDWERGQFLHGGNFHGDAVAAAMDTLRASLAKLTMLAERRLNFFLHQRLNRRLPPFLNAKQPGLTLALQGLQFTATSTTAASQSLAFPHRVHSVPTNADNQDVVSMGTDSALMTVRVVDNAAIVLAIEAVVLAQATDILDAAAKLSPAARKLYREVRSRLPEVVDDRALGDDLDAILSFVRTDASVPFAWAGHP